VALEGVEEDGEAGVELVDDLEGLFLVEQRLLDQARQRKQLVGSGKKCKEKEKTSKE
jgi:hypothetical protein